MARLCGLPTLLYLLGRYDNRHVSVRLAAQVLAVLWVAISLSMAAVPALMLSFDIMGIHQSGRRPMATGRAIVAVLFFVTSATVATTWAFESPADIPRNVAEELAILCLLALSRLVARFFLARRHP